jgi:hypothetical protein
LKTAVARFSPEVFGTLEEAARVLRDSFELPGYELEGFICALARDEEDAAAPGQVEVATTLEERTAKVRFALPAELYAVATEAHRTAARIRVVGTLVKQGRRLTLRHPEGFVVLGDDEALAD